MRAILGGLCALLAAGAVHAAELSRNEADTIMVNMGLGCSAMMTVAVVNGIGTTTAQNELGGIGAFVAVNGPNVALAIVLCKRNGRAALLRETLFYSEDWGWFYYELDPANDRIRVWNKSGVHPLKLP